ncbi:Cytochrome c oxidase copper chaperone [Knufia obscura]|uniref:Cytochrome c oxidase copper chaperone n=2 Tax=Knufia TaxID=430999 RepID=A0AAN8F1P0_9EURO|nr:Cytochrome c oxidase copper chaperone [Knufia obscura]KAK5949676.1 Cytochrome c oxidase copper chaperone [Knufia fluminis]
MGWFSSSPVQAQPFTESSPAPPNNLASDLKSSADSKPAEKVKPCCVCKEEKVSRDDCMLFSRADDPQEDCKSMVDKYRDCMRGYGFKVQ